MNDRYKEYPGKIFKYCYPFTWKKRNKNYLEVEVDRDKFEEQTFMFPPDEDMFPFREKDS